MLIFKIDACDCSTKDDRLSWVMMLLYSNRISISIITCFVYSEIKYRINGRLIMNRPKAGINYYGVLNLKGDCNDLDINKAHLATYYNIRRKNNADITEYSNLIAESYDVLSNPLKRAIYDHYGEIGLKRGVSGPSEYIPPYKFHGDSTSTFRDFFGTSNPYGDLLSILENSAEVESINKQNLSESDKQSLITPLPLSLTEIFFGALKKIEVARLVLSKREKLDNFFDDDTLNIIVPPGLPATTRIIFSGKGDGDTSRIAAKIVCITEDLPHKKFTRQEDNLIMTVNISLNDALSGIVIVVDTLDERILRIPIAPVISAGYQKCVVGEGLPVLAKPNLRGDLILKFEIEFPINSTIANKYRDDEKLCLTGKKRNKKNY